MDTIHLQGECAPLLHIFNKHLEPDGTTRKLLEVSPKDSVEMMRFVDRLEKVYSTKGNPVHLVLDGETNELLHRVLEILSDKEDYNFENNATRIVRI